MANPITWRNIGAPQLDGSTQGLMAAGQSFNNAISALQGTLKGYEATDATNWQQGKVNNTNALMLRLAQLQDPTNAQAQAATVIGDAEGMGAQVDLASVLRAAQARPAELMDQQTKAWAFGDAKQNQADQPMLAAVTELLAQGRDADALNVVNAGRSTGSLGDKNAMALMAKARQIGLENEQQARAAQKHAMDLTGHQADLIYKDAQAANLRSQAALHDAQRRELGADKGLFGKGASGVLKASEDLVKQTEAEFKSAMANSVLGGKSFEEARGDLDKVASDAGTNIFNNLKGHFNAKGTLDKALENLRGNSRMEGNKIRIDTPDGKGSVLVPLPASVVREAFTTNDGWFNPRIGNIETYIEEWAQRPEVKQAALEQTQGQQRVALQRLRHTLTEKAATGDKAAVKQLQDLANGILPGKAKD